MDLYNLKKNKLEEVNRVNFKLEKEIQTLVEENVETLFDLEFISSEFSVGNFRLDSLCFDNETNSFVVIEYKKGSSYSVIDQGYSYMSIMLNNKSDFILEYIEQTGKSLKKSDVDFSQSRILFVSPSFNSYQKNSVNFKDVPFELWEIKKYSNGTIGLDQHVSSSNESIEKVEGNKNSVIKSVSKEVKFYKEEDVLKLSKQHLQNIYHDIKDRISVWEDISFGYKERYISIKKNNKIFVYINFRKEFLKIEFYKIQSYKIKSGRKGFILDDPKNIFKVNKLKYYELYTYDLKNDKDIDYILLMIKQKYDSSN